MQVTGRRQWLVDAFTNTGSARPFTGNPAAVLAPFDAWPDVAWMQALAQENAVSETAFLLKTDEPARFGLRWMTPALEVPLCGHATLAAAHVLFYELGLNADEVTFDTKSGPLLVRLAEDGVGLIMDFPADPPQQVPVTPELEAAFGVPIVEAWSAGYLVVLVDDVARVTECTPNIAAIAKLGKQARSGRGNIAIACLVSDSLGANPNVVSRFFAPGSGIAEDPVTGSLHCILSPLFSAKTGQSTLAYHQAYPRRGGDMVCTLSGDRVIMQGQARTVLEAVLR